MRSGAALACHATPCAHAVASAHRRWARSGPIFGKWMNRPEGPRPARDAAPASARADDAPAPQIDLRLVLEEQLVALERASKLILQRNRSRLSVVISGV